MHGASQGEPCNHAFEDAFGVAVCTFAWQNSHVAQLVVEAVDKSSSSHNLCFVAHLLSVQFITRICQSCPVMPDVSVRLGAYLYGLCLESGYSAIRNCLCCIRQLAVIRYVHHVWKKANA